MNDKHGNYPKHDFMMRMVVGDGIESIDEAVDRLFFALGFRNKLVGTTYLKEAIKLWCGFPYTKRVILTANIYPTIARKLTSTADRVERAIRNTILDCYDNGKMHWLNDLVRSDIITKPYKPTNGEFISNVVSWLRIQSRKHARQLSFLEYIEA